MLRDDINEALKTAMKASDPVSRDALRLIVAGMKNKDVDARAKGNQAGIGDDEIRQMLQGMIKQRHESIALYEKGGRPELAAKERGEIAVIERFLPKQLDDAGIEAAVKAAIAETGAASVKDTGKVMGVLKQKHAGALDMGKAGAAVRKLLGT
jgi:uncharacterized protein YqeY